MLELKNIVFEVREETGETRRILDDISLRLDEDMFYVVTGPNGSGKSTLARIIMGIEGQKESSRSRLRALIHHL